MLYKYTDFFTERDTRKTNKNQITFLYITQKAQI